MPRSTRTYLLVPSIMFQLLFLSEENPPQDIINEESDNKAVDDCSKDYEPENEDSEEEEINANSQIFSKRKYILVLSIFLFKVVAKLTLSQHLSLACLKEEISLLLLILCEKIMNQNDILNPMFMKLLEETCY